MQRQMIQDSIKSQTLPTYHSIDDIDEAIDLAFKNEKVIKTGKRIAYYNFPAAFDIETTSFTEDGQKRGTMYEWTLGLNGHIIIGRTWSEFIEVIDRIVTVMELSESKRLLIYVHNLSFELQFIQHYFHFTKVFANAPRKPIYALADNGIEFRCSLLLSGYKLATLAENLTTFKVRKLDSLNYDLCRHSQTPMTDEELLYCVYDVIIVMAFICEEIEQNNGKITQIPLTKTGYVRRFCRQSCLEEPGVPKRRSKKFWDYRKLMRNLKITSVDELQQWQRAFMGGFTHENPFYSRYTLKNVDSDDETSAYPAMAVEWDGFPMSSGELYTIKDMADFEKQIKLYCCIFDIEFVNLRPAVDYENYISVSRCWNVKNPIENNGRLVSCDSCCTTITEIDFKIIRFFYNWDSIRIRDFRRYRKGRLPKDLVKAILKLYSDKTKLKGFKADTPEEQLLIDQRYMASKAMLNAVYGCMVQSPIKPEVDFADGLWELEALNYEDAIDKYNGNWSRFLFFPWGIYICALNRMCIMSCIREFGMDYVYSDTDSIKTLHREDHIEFINRYNEDNRNRMLKAMKFYNLPADLIEPETVKGEKKVLGSLEWEGTYDRFCGLGAKRYMVEKDGKISITVSGLNKHVAGPYLVETYGKDKVFDHFDDELEVPAEFTGKLTHTYIDDPTTGMLTDYLGNTARYAELSSIHLGAAPYELSLAQKYKDYLNNLLMNHRRKT